MCQFVPHFLSYIFAKYYLNWFAVGKVVAKNNKGELFIETQCISFFSFSVTFSVATKIYFSNFTNEYMHKCLAQCRV